MYLQVLKPKDTIPNAFSISQNMLIELTFWQLVKIYFGAILKVNIKLDINSSKEEMKVFFDANVENRRGVDKAIVLLTN